MSRSSSSSQAGLRHQTAGFRGRNVGEGKNGPSRRATDGATTRPTGHNSQEQTIGSGRDLGAPSDTELRPRGPASPSSTADRDTPTSLAITSCSRLGTWGMMGLRRVAWMPSQCSPMLLSPSLAGWLAGGPVRRRPAPGIQGLVFFFHHLPSVDDGGGAHREGELCVCVNVRALCVCVCRAQDGHPSTPVLAPPTT